MEQKFKDVEPKPIVVKLKSPVCCGDWHDKPLKWEVKWGSKNQLFDTKKNAENYARIWKRLGLKSESEAIRAYISI